VKPAAVLQSTMRSASQLSRPRAGWHQTARVVIITALCLAPAPFGSTAPFVYMTWTVLFALLTSALAFMAPLDRRLRLAIPAFFFALALIWALVQTLPLSGIMSYAPLVRGQSVPQLQISASLGETILFVLRQLGYALLFVLLVQLTPRQSQRLLVMRCLALAALFYAVYGILALHEFGDTTWGVAKEAHLGNATGPFRNRNTFATFLAMGLALNLSLCLFRGRRYEHLTPWRDGMAWMHGGICIVLFATVLTTSSRMGLLVSLVGIGCVLLFWIAAHGGTIGRVLTVILAIIGLGGAIAAIFGGAAWDRISTADADFDIRLAIFRLAITMIEQRPWLGWGAGAFQQSFPAVRDTTLLTDTVINRAHNTYLGLAVELGIPAALSLVAAVSAVALRTLWTAIRRGVSPETSAAVAATMIVLLHSTMDFSLEIPGVALVFVAILALGYSDALNSDEKMRQQKKH